MTNRIAAEHSDVGACIITGRTSNLDRHEPGDFRRSRDPGSHLDPRKRVLIWRKFHDDITFQGWRDELKDGRYRCWNADGELVRDVRSGWTKGLVAWWLTGRIRRWSRAWACCYPSPACRR
jgi:hypothetical protein